MKNLYFLLMMWLPAFALQAQDCPSYFSFEPGQEMVYETYNHKDKLEGKHVQKLIRVEGNTLYFESEMFDKKGKSAGVVNYDVVCEDGKVKINMSSMMMPGLEEQYEGMEMEMESDYLEMPHTLTPGATLPDGEMEMKINSNGMTMMTINMNITDRKVEGTEEITTPMGTYTAYKLTNSFTSKMGFVNASGSSVEYYVDGYGLIRSESYNKKGKLTSYMVRVK